MSRGERGYNVLFIKQVGMCACTEHNENEFLVVLLPNEQPVRLDVTLPLTLAVAVELMRLVFCRQCARLGKQHNSILDKLHVIATLLATLHVFFKAFRWYNLVPHTLTPNSLNISSTDS